MLPKQTPDDYYIIFSYCSVLPEDWGGGGLAFFEHLALRRLDWRSGSGNTGPAQEQGERVVDCYSLVTLPFLSVAGILLGSVVHPLPCDSVGSPDWAPVILNRDNIVIGVR